MIHDTLLLIFIFGILFYIIPFKINQLFIFGIILYILYTKFIQNKTKLYDDIHEIITPNKKQEFIDSYPYIKNINNYNTYDKISFDSGLLKYKKYDKYINKINDDNNKKDNKNIIENCKYYLDESKIYFGYILNKIEDKSEYTELKKYIDDYYKYYNHKLFEIIHKLHLEKELYKSPSGYDSL